MKQLTNQDIIALQTSDICWMEVETHYMTKSGTVIVTDVNSKKIKFTKVDGDDHFIPMDISLASMLRKNGDWVMYSSGSKMVVKIFK